MGGVGFPGKKALRRCKVQRYKRYESVGGGQIPRNKALHLVGAGLRRVSDFLENSVTNVTLLRVTPVWVGVKFPETTVITLECPPPS